MKAGTDFQEGWILLENVLGSLGRHVAALGADPFVPLWVLMTWDVYLFFKQICKRVLGDRDWAQDGEDSSSQKALAWLSALYKLLLTQEH